jgi:hypothetical protein
MTTFCQLATTVIGFYNLRIILKTASTAEDCRVALDMGLILESQDSRWFGGRD